MKQSTYNQKLKDPRWQKKRLQMLEAAEWRCEVCMNAESTLHVHHKAYFKGREPWEYEDQELAVLCENCHENQHEGPDALAMIVAALPLDGPNSREEIAHLIFGFVNSSGLRDGWLQDVCLPTLQSASKWHEYLQHAGRNASEFFAERIKAGTA